MFRALTLLIIRRYQRLHIYNYDVRLPMISRVNAQNM
jgi:hypothetical protein